MRAFNSEGDDIEKSLREQCFDGEVYSVGLARYSLIFDIANVKIHVRYRADFSISGSNYSYTGEPVDAPLWLLAGQACKEFKLINDCCVRIQLDSGDMIDLWTEEGQWESILFWWPKRAADQNFQLLDVF